jgi:hypothetical protein
VARLAAGVLVSALLRRVAAEGGHGAVLARGDASAGALLIQLADRGVAGPLLERLLDRTGTYRWTPTGPEGEERTEYLAGRRRSDPDLWVVELDHPAAAALVADVTADLD